MASILNKVKVWWFGKRLTNNQTRFDFYKDYLPIKTKGIKDKLKHKKEVLDLKQKNELLPFEIKAGVASDFLKIEFDSVKKQVEDKYYWKKRELTQTLIHNNVEDKSGIDALDKALKEEVEKITSEFYIKNPEKSDVLAYEENSKLISEKYLELNNNITKKSDNKIEKIKSKIDHLLAKYESGIKTYTQKLNEVVGNHVNDSKLEEDILLKVENLSMHFGGLKAVDDLSFNVKNGEIFGLIGPNGAGKTTVFNCITRFYKPTFGDMYFRNNLGKVVDLNTIVVHNVIKEGIVRTFQNVEMIWELNVIENLLVAAHTQYRSGFFSHLFNSRLLRQEEEVMRRKAMMILKDLDLTAYAYQYPMGLPYGILKKIELARTLMVNPKLIILDEPAAGLNDSETAVLAQTIRKIQKEYNTTIFLVEHDMGLVMDICDTICAISFGHKLAIGTPKEIQNSKVVREAYLGGE